MVELINEPNLAFRDQFTFEPTKNGCKGQYLTESEDATLTQIWNFCNKLPGNRVLKHGIEMNYDFQFNYYAFYNTVGIILDGMTFRIAKLKDTSDTFGMIEKRLGVSDESRLFDDDNQMDEGSDNFHYPHITNSSVATTTELTNVNDSFDGWAIRVKDNKGNDYHRDFLYIVENDSDSLEWQGDKNTAGDPLKLCQSGMENEINRLAAGLLGFSFSMKPPAVNSMKVARGQGWVITNRR